MALLFCFETSPTPSHRGHAVSGCSNQAHPSSPGSLGCVWRCARVMEEGPQRERDVLTVFSSDAWYPGPPEGTETGGRLQG